MNGAAVNCKQEQALHPQHNDTSSPGYLLQNNYPCQEKHSQQQYSKAMNYKLLPDNFSVDDSSKYSQYIGGYSSEPRNRLSNSGDIWSDRISPTRIVREPMELPVPKFEIDENSVGVFTYKKDKTSSVEDSKDLDLDTRIDLLIKSKALSGMHPIFSELNESEDSSMDSDDSYSDLSKLKSTKHDSEKHVLHQESFDDPEKPLSRPPSPFLSRATYLFWFNKAIELKQQAKAQEQALLEEATKKLIQGNLSSGKVSKTSNSKQDSNLLKNLLNEVSKELKESIKQDFIKEIIENTVLNSLEDWWVKERNLDEDKFSKDFSMVSSTTNLQSKDKMEMNETAEFRANIANKESQNQRSTSPEVLQLPLSENVKQKAKGNQNILENQVTSIIKLNKTLVKEFGTDVLEGLTSEQSVLCKRISHLETKNVCESSTVDTSSFRDINPLNLEEIGTDNSINKTEDTLDPKHASASNNKICIEDSIKNLQEDLKVVINVPVNAEESNNHPVMENLPLLVKSVVKSQKENTLDKMEIVESSENNDMGIIKELDTLEKLEENRLTSEDLSVKKDHFLRDLINNKENNAEIKQNEKQ